MKKIAALFIVFSLLIPNLPVVIAEDAPTKPTIEEIFNEYHQKAFQAETTEDTAAVMNVMCRANAGDTTLEKETVEHLNAAGYEAYNITSENYLAIESHLQTDFSDMGINPGSSYIIAISGENDNNMEAANNISPFAIVPTPDPGSGSDYFNYVYNGITYRMRYVTVTSNDDSRYAKASNHSLLTTYFDSFLDRLLGSSLTAYFDSLNAHVPFGTIASILGVSDYFNRYKTSLSTLDYDASTRWVRSYIQVWNSYDEAWSNASYSEYVVMHSVTSGHLYDYDLVSYVYISDTQVDGTKYSTNYYNSEQRKIDAVVGYNSYSIVSDIVGDVIYRYDDTTIAHHRENF